MGNNYEESLFKNFLFVSKDSVKKRMDICKQCPHLTKMHRCLECGCFMKVKSKLTLMDCPLGKW